MFKKAAGKTFILDWKTNRIPAELRRLYRAQLAAYWRAVRELSGSLVEAAIYSTATGQIYTEDELASEWERLSDLAPAKFTALIGLEQRWRVEPEAFGQ